MKASRKVTLPAAIVFLVMAATVFVAIDQTLPPESLSAGAAATEFSAERAIEHIEAIAQEPRLVGEPGFEAARDYVIGELTRLGLPPEIQRTRITIPEDLRLTLGPYVTPSQQVENVVARIEGAESQEAILLAAHLDSVGGPGATDDASGVAILLESARALLAGLPLRNTVLLLFTAPEETGTHGAVAFLLEHPWRNDVRLVINIDAGGLAGPSELTNTSPNNGWLIRELGRANPYAFGSSSSGAGDSDFNTFKFYGFSGYAFDYSRDRRIHTPFDNLDNLNPSSIQHQGYHALYLTRHFGNLASLQDPREPSPVYFNVLRLGLVHYPATWVIPITLLGALVLAGVLALGFRRRCLTYRGIGWGALVLTVSLVTAPLAARLLWAALSGLVPKYQVTYFGHAVDEPLLLTIFASMALALTTTWIVLIQRVNKVGLADLTLGALALLFLVMVGLSIASPGESYGITWPFLASLLAAGYWIASMKQDQDSFSAAQLFGLLVAAVVAIVVLLPSFYMGFTGSATDDLFMPMTTLVTTLGLLVPQLHVVIRPHPWWLPVAAGLSAVVLLGVALFG
jgi:hypothetical protein